MSRTINTIEISKVETSEQNIIIASKNSGVRLNSNPDASEMAFSSVGTDSHLKILEPDGSYTTVTLALSNVQVALDSSIGDFKVIKANGETLTLNDLMYRESSEWDSIAKNNIFKQPNESDYIESIKKQAEQQAEQDVEKIKQQAEQEAQQIIEQAKEIKKQAEQDAEEQKQQSNKNANQKNAEKATRQASQQTQERSESTEESQDESSLKPIEQKIVQPSKQAVENTGNDDGDGESDETSADFLDTDAVEPTEVKTEILDESVLRPKLTFDNAQSGLNTNALEFPITIKGENLSTIVITTDYAKEGFEKITLKLDERGNGKTTLSLKDIVDGATGEIKFSVTDTSGNEGEYIYSYTYDTTAPEITVALTDATNSGNKNDLVTNVSKSILKMTSGVDDTVQITVKDKDGNPVDITIGGPSPVSGTNKVQRLITFDKADGLDDGDYTITYSSTDSAGNESGEKHTTLKIDSTAPQMPVVTLESGHDTYRPDLPNGDKDFITKKQNPTVHITTEPNITTTVTIKKSDGSLLPADQYTWNPSTGRLTFTNDLPDGDYTITATATSNSSTTALSQQTLTIDTTAPNLPALVLKAGDDTGVSDSDWIIQTKKPTIKVVQPNQDAGKLTVVVKKNGVDIKTQGINYRLSNDGTEIIFQNDLGDGAYTVEVTATDKAGNELTKSQTLTVDNTVTKVGRGATEEWYVHTDFRHYNDEPWSWATLQKDSATSILPYNVEQGLRSHIYLEANERSKAVLEIYKKGVTGQYDTLVKELKSSRYHNFHDIYSGKLDEGEYEFVLTLTDKAGNTNQTVRKVKVDYTPPADATAVVLKKRDSDNTVITDNGKVNDNNLKIDFNVGALNQALVRIKKPDGSFQAYHNNRSELKAGADGKLSFNIDMTNFADGEYEIQIDVRDTAGNGTGYKTYKTFTIDRKAEAPTFTLNGKQSNHEDSSTIKDFYTNNKNTELTFTLPSGTTNDRVTDITVYRLNADGSTTQLTKGTHYTETETGGIYKITPKNAPDNAKYRVDVKVEDDAGNSHTYRQKINLDTDAPNAPTVKLVNNTDTGNSSTDLITKENSLSLEIQTEEGARVKLILKNKSGGKIQYDDIKYTAGDDGKVIFNLNHLFDGTYKIETVITDKAGNKSTSYTNGQDLVIDKTAPTITTADENLSQDGVQVSTSNLSTFKIEGTDLGSKGKTLKFTITADDGSGTLTKTINVANDGAWKLESKDQDFITMLNQSDVKIQVEDDAGNSWDNPISVDYTGNDGI